MPNHALRRFVLLSATVLVSAASQPAAAHPLVPAFERFYTAAEADAVRGGQLLLNELNCVACHGVEEPLTTVVQPKPAPILDQVSGRVKAAYLREFLADPAAVKPGTNMPHLLAGVADAEKKEQVEALVHFLMSIGPGQPEQAYPSASGRVRGEDLFHKIGCAACHGERLENSPTLPTSKPLGDLTKKYTLPSLAAFLQDPLHSRPSGRMPSLNLSGREAFDIASFLLPHLPAKAGITYAYYEGNWNDLPDFDSLKPVATGDVESIDVNPKKRGDQFGLRFEGVLQIDRDGEYTFHLGSDDGSRLWIGDKVIVDNGGVHPPGFKSGKATLTKGRHAVVITFFEAGGGEELTAEFEGPGLKRQPMANAMLAGNPAEPLEDVSFTVDASKAARGRQLFESLKCSACHAVTIDGQRIAAAAAKPLKSLAAGGGCTAAEPAKGLPRFQLNAAQTAAINAALKTIAAVRPPADDERLARTLVGFNCVACHARGELGGIEEPRNAWFQTTQPEMGDEGRIPPHLDGTGAKLTEDWLKSILANGAKDRPYMFTRMPKFGEANVGHLQPLLTKLDLTEPPLPPIELSPKDAKQAGWKMAGDKGFSCIKCHTFGPFKATGVQSIDLQIMSKRLREDWFRRYVRNPQVYRRGTRMPNAWPPTGPSLLPAILDGDSDKQIQAVWTYLADGPRARTPEGLVSDSMELMPTGEALIYRNFIEGAGPRAIGVGYPEGVHLAFDANQMRLALIWKGAFIDAKRHWSGRGEGFQAPAGQDVQKLPDGASFAVLENETAAWPNLPAKQLGIAFRGYRLSVDQRPTFLYDYAGVKVEDFPNPVEQGPNVWFSRKLTLTAAADNPPTGLWFRAASGSSIQPLADGWYQAGALQIRVTASKPAIARGNELLVPIEFQNGKAELAQEIKW